MEDLKQWLDVANGVGVVGLLFIILYLIITGRLASQSTIKQMNEAHDARAQLASDRLAEAIAERMAEATRSAIVAAIGAALDKSETLRTKEQEVWRSELHEMEQASNKRDEEWRQTIHTLVERIDSLAAQHTEAMREMGAQHTESLREMGAQQTDAMRQMGAQISANSGSIQRHSDTLGAIVQYIDETRRLFASGGK